MKRIYLAAGALLVPFIWIFVKFWFKVNDGLLPPPSAVLSAIQDIYPPIYYHIAITWARLIIGSCIGIAFGLSLALLMHRFDSIRQLLLPTVQSMRAVPPVAMVPFFLLWFGFSEFGKYLLITAGIGFNIAISSIQIAEDIPERYRIFFKGINRNPSLFPLSFALPRILQGIKPTIRFSISTATGLVVVSELLGSQLGLGYLIQSARSTFATQTIFLSAIILGILSTLTDAAVSSTWDYLVPWNDVKTY